MRVLAQISELHGISITMMLLGVDETWMPLMMYSKNVKAACAFSQLLQNHYINTAEFIGVMDDPNQALFALQN